MRARRALLVAIVAVVPTAAGGCGAILGIDLDDPAPAPIAAESGAVDRAADGEGDALQDAADADTASPPQDATSEDATDADAGD